MNLYLTLEPRPETLSLLRNTANSFFSLISQNEASEIVTALSEAVSNCIMHAKSSYTVYLRVDQKDAGNALVTITISDSSGIFFNGNRYCPPASGSFEGEMGIMIMRSIMDDMHWVPNETGTTVVMTKQCVLTSPQEINVPGKAIAC